MEIPQYLQGRNSKPVRSGERPVSSYLHEIIEEAKEELRETRALKPLLVLASTDGQVVKVPIDPRFLDNKEEMCDNIKSVISATRPASVCFLVESWVYTAAAKSEEELAQLAAGVQVGENGVVLAAQNMTRKEAITIQFVVFNTPEGKNNSLGFIEFDRNTDGSIADFVNESWIDTGTQVQGTMVL